MHRVPAGFDAKISSLSFDTSLSLVDNWLAYHRLFGVEHFYIYSSVFRVIATDAEEKQLRAVEAKLHKHLSQYPFVTLVPWRLPV